MTSDKLNCYRNTLSSRTKSGTKLLAAGAFVVAAFFAGDAESAYGLVLFSAPPQAAFFRVNGMIPNERDDERGCV